MCAWFENSSIASECRAPAAEKRIMYHRKPITFSNEYICFVSKTLMFTHNFQRN